VTTLWPDIVTAFATIATAGAAAWAAIVATRIATADRQASDSRAKADRQHGLQLWQVDQTSRRFDETQELLIAFDVYATFRPPRYEGVRHSLLEEPDEARPAKEVQLRQAHAEFLGRLRASTENLPFTRQICFEHIPPNNSELEIVLKGFLSAVGTVGNLETENLEILVIRGELLFTLQQLRQDLDHQRADLGSPDQAKAL
jgi:hypothetical protein